MTEANWHTSSDPSSMLELLRGKTSDRKLRLFACACCRRLWDLLKEKGSRQAVEVAERFADGQADEAKLVLAWYGASQAVTIGSGRDAVRAAALPTTLRTTWGPTWEAFEARLRAAKDWPEWVQGPLVRAFAECREFTIEDVPRRAAESAARLAGLAAFDEWCEHHPAPAEDGYSEAQAVKQAAYASERVGQAELLRHIFGNPFSTVAKREPHLSLITLYHLGKCVGRP